MKLIFDQLITELRFSPFRELEWPPPEWWSFPTACPICGTIDLSQFPVPEHDEPICQDCWIRNRHKEPELWHCADCSKYVHGLDRFVFWLSTGNASVIVCADHYFKRSGEVHA